MGANLRSVDQAMVGRIGACLIFALGFGCYISFELQIAPLRGLWHDEYFSLYAADLHTPSGVLFADTNTPLYYLLVRAALLAGLQGAAALAVVNQFAIIVFSAIVLWLFGRAGRFWFGLAAIGITLAIPTVLTFSLEGRVYAFAQFSCLALSAAVLTRLELGTAQI